jgi:hypothetical protein
VSEPHVLVIEGPCEQADPETGACECAEDRQRCDYTWRIECPGVTRACEMFLECPECKDPKDPARQDELDRDSEAHGVEHDHIPGLGWATPTGSCYVQNADLIGDAVSDLSLPPGRHLVDHDYGDPDEITLHVIEPDLEKWRALADACMFAGCDNDEIDQRGPVSLRDGSMHKACVEHWESIMRVLGQQATWEWTDAMREASR